MTIKPAMHAEDSAAAERLALSLCRGVQRLMRMHDFATLTEMPLGNGRRADVVAVSPRGDIHIIEIKSSIADFRSDQKWPEYRDFCDTFSFAVAADFPAGILPGNAGLIIADAYGAEVIRTGDRHTLSGARRKAVLLAFARGAAMRLHAGHDPSLDM